MGNAFYRRSEPEAKAPHLTEASGDKRKRPTSDDASATTKLQKQAAVTPSRAPLKKRAKTTQQQHPERAIILKRIPDHVQVMFGQIGFAKFGKKLRQPVLIADIAQAPEGKVWEQWHEAYERCRKEKRTQHVPYLVYYYQNDGDNCFGVVSQSSFTPYERELKKGSKGFTKLPKRIQTKLDNGEELTFHDEITIEGYREMEEDLRKDPLDRKRWI